MDGWMGRKGGTWPLPLLTLLSSHYIATVLCMYENAQNLIM